MVRTLEKKIHDQLITNAGIRETLFNDLPEKEYLQIDAGSILTRVNDKPLHIYQILSGVVVIKAPDPAGISRFVDLCSNQELIGMVNAVMDTPYHYDTIAITELRAIHIRSDVFNHYLDNDPFFSAQILYLLTKVTATKEGHLYNLIHMKVYDRIIYLIIRLVQLLGYDQHNRIPFLMRIDILSQLTGSKVSSIYRALKKLNRTNGAYFENNSIYIQNIDLLKVQLSGKLDLMMY